MEEQGKLYNSDERQRHLSARLHMAIWLVRLSRVFFMVTVVGTLGIFYYVVQHGHHLSARSTMLMLYLPLGGGVFCTAIVLGAAAILARRGIDPTIDFWAIGPLLDVLGSTFDGKNFYKPLADLLAHVNRADCCVLTGAQRQVLHRFIASYHFTAQYETRVEWLREVRRKLLEGALHLIDLLEDTGAILALEKFRSQATEKDKNKIDPLLEKLRALASQQNAPTSLVRAAEGPSAELLRPTSPSEDKDATDTLIRPSQP